MKTNIEIIHELNIRINIDRKEMRICRNKTVKLCFMLKKINNYTLLT